MAMTLALPRFVALKSKYSSKYLRYVHEDGEVHGFVQFSGEEVATPYTKYEVEVSKNYDGLVHIRCCYNNKYWGRSSPDKHWIVAGAIEKNEDKSLWSCTLFQPEHVDGDAKTVRFRHTQLGNYACLMRYSAPYGNCLSAEWASPNEDSCDVCEIIDWETLLVLPKYIAFKGDNGKYLQGYWNGSHAYQMFASSDMGDPNARYEVFTTPDGSIRIKSLTFDRFWRRSPNWIWADTYDTTNENPDTLFSAVRVNNNNVVALRNLGNNNFCTRLSLDGKTDCLNAAASTITKEARLEVEELVLSREIYNVKFQIDNARIYGESLLVMNTQEVINNTQATNTQELEFKYEETKSHSWSSSVSLKLGVKLTIESGIPFIEKGEVEISTEFSGGYEWGETESTTSTTTSKVSVPVPPMTTMTMSLLATNGHCDVPFSYSQRDTHTDGTTETNDFYDGVFTGINCYNFRYVTNEEKISS